MSLFFYLFTFAINLWHRKFVTEDAIAVLVNNQHGIKRRGQDFDKNVYLKGYPAKRLTDEFPEKSWTKRNVNKLFKKLRNTGTVDRRPDSGRPRSDGTEENAKLLFQMFPQPATEFVLPIVM